MKRKDFVIMNKRGVVGDQLTFFPLLFLMVIIGGGITLGVYLFYSDGYDFRDVEAELINYKIRNCILENDVNEGFFNEFFEKCRLNKEVIEKYSIIKICEGFGDCAVRETNVVFSSGSNFNVCAIKSARKNDAFPRCFVGRVEKIGKDFETDKNYEVVVGANQKSRRGVG